MLSQTARLIGLVGWRLLLLLVTLRDCKEDLQERMIGHLTQCDENYGRRVAEGPGRKVGELTAETA